MGIPGLQNLLQPYTTQHIFPLTTTPTTIPASFTNPPVLNPGEHLIIIDGPALAHHAYAIARAKLRSLQPSTQIVSRQTARGAGPTLRHATIQPSYAAINAAAFAWLAALRRAGCVVGAIVFDGGLPDWKVDVRRERLTKSIQTLASARKALADTDDDDEPRFLDDNIAFSDSDLFGARSWSAALLGKPPRLADSLRECLNSSDYASITCIVPNEADPFCAAYARAFGAVVVTSDSDLCVYDIGDKGRVVNFHQISLVDVEGPALAMNFFSPRETAQQLGVRSLVELAFSVRSDQHRSLAQHVQHAKVWEVSPPKGLAIFRAEYPTDVDLASFDEGCALAVSKAKQAFSSLVSELVVQSCTAGSTWEVWFPVLHEDTTRTAAWLTGTEIRRAAYSLLGQCPSIVSKPDVVVEHYCKAARAWLQQAIAFVSSSLDLVTNGEHRATWRDLGLMSLIQSQKESGKTVPSRDGLLKISCANFGMSWTLLHWCAQLQALLTSWRMLEQMLGYVLAHHGKDDEAVNGLRTLHELLSDIDGGTMPLMFDPISYTKVHMDWVNRVIDIAFQHKNKNRKKTRQRNTGKVRKQQDNTGLKNTKSSNQYCLLDQAYE
ncbi:hypothetical protein BT63DRAFT_418745 [Microthyrium microscopicum]|uniref:Asteroid domain-containing protein n=1 Tax=Microthyrium microscopicum TaxID=703497 RepID=A0A6A6TWZ1_9PEZI|nr:hypothetical protein BT63DRAFT_418745 [Microthyrium microscopicum]